MGANHIKEPLNQFIKKIPPFIKVDEVIVFGSYLEGNATEDSDIDLFVISDSFKGMDLENRLDILYDATDNIEPDIHPWGHTSEELKSASHLTLLGYARDKGLRYDPAKL